MARLLRALDRGLANSRIGIVQVTPALLRRLPSFAHVAPLGWEHIAFNGDYVWPAEPLDPHLSRPLADWRG